ncbi:MAG: hypothetical protein J0I74_13320 [Rhodanobacter sp.]|nr:hypothetical protein [Rhodanobacter sp.]
MSKQTDITMALVDGPDLAFMANVGASFEDLVDFLADGRQAASPVEMPIADEWLTDDQADEVRAAMVKRLEGVELTGGEDIFSRYGI